MRSAVRPGIVARNLVTFWNDARLRVSEAKSSSVKPAPGVVPWHAALEDMLKVGYGAQAQSRFVNGAWERVHWRTTPSAGALYPFEVIASIVGEGSYLWDVEAGHLVPLALPPLGADELAEAGLTAAPGQHVQALLVIVARPWLSMRKYRLRGYAYCHLDAGHAAANIALYSAALGLTPNLHLRFARDRLAAGLRLDGLCREALVALSFTSAEGQAGRPVPRQGALAVEVPFPRMAQGMGPVAPETVHPAEAAQEIALQSAPPPVLLEPPLPAESANWESLRGILAGDCVLERPLPPAAARLLVEPAPGREEDLLPLPDGRPVPAEAAHWRAAILGRRSAKGFRDEPLSLIQVAELLAALRADSVPADCCGTRAAHLGVRLVARRVTGLGGVYAYAPRSHALHRIAPRAGNLVPACMQQQVAQNVAALMILHAPICRLVDEHGYSAFAELHCKAAEVGQRLHLAAVRLGAVGLTCLGGFDGEECAVLAHLDAATDGEAIYVILLGIPDEAAFKHDRLNVAFSHGHTTLEG